MSTFVCGCRGLWVRLPERPGMRGAGVQIIIQRRERGAAGEEGPSRRAAPFGPGFRLKGRWLKPVLEPEELVEERVEHRPAGPCCADCRHLGALVRITEPDGARRWRRRCPVSAAGHTDPAWPVCPGYEAAEER